MENMDPWVEPPFIGDGTDAETFFIDGMQGASFVAGAVKLNMFQYVQVFAENGDAHVRRQIIGRLAMSEATLRGVNAWLTAMIQDIDAAAAAAAAAAEEKNKANG
ncbi:MAG: hypothetical protein O9248_01695 [Rhodobacteraceae bacterium]|nr:hypothetical protein [Paracoccaceae bacterium]